MGIKIPKKICVELDMKGESANLKVTTKNNSKSEIKARRKVFSGGGL